MSTVSQNYRNPPIIEAVLELSFDCEWAEAAADRLERLLRVDYPGEPRVRGRIEPPQQVKLFPSVDGRRVVGIGVGFGLMTVHTLKPYSGWEPFLAQARTAISQYVEALNPSGLVSLGIRYLDRILIPGREDGNVLLEDYFIGIPIKPPSMPEVLGGFHIALQGMDPDGTSALLTLTRGEPSKKDDDGLVVLYDLNLVRCFDPSTNIASWEACAEELHIRQRDIFEESITEKTRELFR